MRVLILFAISAALVAAPSSTASAQAAGDSVAVSAKWDNVVKVSETVPTTQHLANALTLRSNPLNRRLLKALRDLHTNDTRLQLWYSVPNQVVAELKEPTATETFWDFKYMDPVVIDFFANTTGVHHINIGTIPRWMFKVPPADIPSDPAASYYLYTQGTTGELLKDTTGKQFADFQTRIYQWYTQGGFIDEIGKYHKSGYHFKIDYWGILNEPDFENNLTVEQYTRIWDSVAEAIHKIDPSVQFVGPEISGAEVSWARYFLNPKNHNPSAPPVQFFSLHNYVSSNNDPQTWQAKYFTAPTGAGGSFSARAFIDQLHVVMKIRDDLSPATRIVIDELGTFDQVRPVDGGGPDDEPYVAYNPLYWVAMGANWADNFITAENEGIPLISMTQMLGYATQSPSCTMVNPKTAHPNSHYWVLKLVNSNFGPGDKLVATQSSSTDIVAQASLTSAGRKVLLVNTSNRTVPVNLADTFSDSSLNIEVVDETSGEQPPRKERVTGKSVTLAPFAIAVVTGEGK
jgi:hypothetical protein